jgi:hypothetical protein
VLKNITPKFKEESFNCPHCQEFANQRWKQIYSQQDPDTTYAFCQSCFKCSIWENGELIYPKIGIIPIPNEDMPMDVKKDYEEARLIVNDSPRGACALLRLAVKKLFDNLNIDGNNLEAKITNLVKEGFPTEVQKALESVKVIGFQSIHPGEMDLDDDDNTATVLFGILNFVVEEKISRPKEIKDIYKLLPKK